MVTFSYLKPTTQLPTEMNTYVLMSEGGETIGPLLQQEVDELCKTDAHFTILEEDLFKVMYPNKHIEMIAHTQVNELLEVWLTAMDNVERTIYIDEDGFVFNDYWIIEVRSSLMNVSFYENCCAVEAAKVINCLKSRLPEIEIQINSLQAFSEKFQNN